MPLIAARSHGGIAGIQRTRSRTSPVPHRTGTAVVLYYCTLPIIDLVHVTIVLYRTGPDPVGPQSECARALHMLCKAPGIQGGGTVTECNECVADPTLELKAATCNNTEVRKFCRNK